MMFVCVLTAIGVYLTSDSGYFDSDGGFEFQQLLKKVLSPDHKKMLMHASGFFPTGDIQLDLKTLRNTLNNANISMAGRKLKSKILGS